MEAIGIKGIIDWLMEDCRRLVKGDGSVPDGMGGQRNLWVEGERFRAWVRKDQDRYELAGQRRVSDAKFTVVVEDGVTLGYHDVFRRAADGAVFRVTGDTREEMAPGLSATPIAKAPCERWALT